MKINKGFIALLVTSIVWGTTWVASKIGVQEMPALQMAALRQLFAGLCFVSFFMLVKKIPLPTAKQFRWLLVMALLMFVFANGLSTWSLQYIPTGLSALIGALYPLSVVLIERFIYKKQNMNNLTIIGLLLGIAGVGIVFYESAFGRLDGPFIFGLGLSIFAMLCWSLGTVFLARNKVNINPYYGTGWQMLMSSAMLFITSEITQPTIPLTTVSVKTWLVIFYLVFLGSILAFIAFIYTVKTLPAAVSSLYAYVNPLVAMVLAALLLSEKLTLHILWGSVVTLLGMYLVNHSMRKKITVVIEPEQ